MNIFLEKIALKMDIIPAYGTEHLIIAVLVLILSIFFAIITRKVKNRTLYLLLGVILIGSEVIKQFFLTYVRGSYCWSAFPFQLCSMPMYLCILYAFFPCSCIEDFLMLYATIGAVAAFIEPTSSFTGYVFLTVHSILWHAVILFLGIRQMLLFIHEKDISAARYISAAKLYLVLACIAVLVNACFYRVSSGTGNMFFLGPGHPNVIILERVYERFGWVIETLLMMAATELLGGIIFGVLTLINRRSVKIRYD